MWGGGSKYLQNVSLHFQGPPSLHFGYAPIQTVLMIYIYIYYIYIYLYLYIYIYYISIYLYIYIYYIIYIYISISILYIYILYIYYILHIYTYSISTISNSWVWVKIGSPTYWMQNISISSSRRGFFQVIPGPTGPQRFDPQMWRKIWGKISRR